MKHSNYATLEELILENNLLREEITRKECEIINLTSCKNTYSSYHKLEDHLPFSDNDNDYWTSKLEEYGVNTVFEARHLRNIEAFEDSENFSIDELVYYIDNDPKEINFLRSENFNIYSLGGSDYPEKLYAD
jgi:hypothetical protein